MNFDPCRAEFILGVKKIYFHFLPFPDLFTLHIERNKLHIWGLDYTLHIKSNRLHI